MNDIADLVCFSHLRWGFIYQRPNHLMSRFARHLRTFFFEEPVFDASKPDLEIRQITPTLRVAVPHLSPGVIPEVAAVQQEKLLEIMMDRFRVERAAAWFYTPMALPFAGVLRPRVTVYDCMDELTRFLGAPPLMSTMEEELLRRADVVFTGGQSLFESKRHRHSNVHAFPSSVEVEHFGRARTLQDEPEDQASLRRPRVGYFGAVDERLDLAILERLAAELHDWQIVMIGPVVKIDPRSLPRRTNIHYLGLQPYEKLPAYLAGWDVAMMPFALNDATRFISPTKTLEYLAGGKPVVSTAVRDVVRPYGERGIVTIADLDSFPAAVRAARGRGLNTAAEQVLKDASWDVVANRMWSLVERALASRNGTVAMGATACSII
jgi:hypothetical protein